MRKTRPWTKDEYNYLREHYLDSISSLTSKLNRTWSSIKHKYLRMGLTRHNKVTHPWIGRKHPHRRKFEFRQLNEDLSYLLGVYLGDGSVYKNEQGAVFSHSSIDEDFIKKTQEAVLNILKYKPTYCYYENKQQYSLRVCSTDFAEWLLNVTNNKEKIPDIIFKTNEKNICAFLNGLLDSEASITSRFDKRYKEKYYQMYFAVTSPWITDIKNLLTKVRVKTSPIRKTSGIPRFAINILSFFKSKLKFSINRKQKLVEDYISNYHLEELK